MEIDLDDLITTLGIGDRSDEEKEDILNEAYARIGSALSAGLSEQQENEYQAISEGNQSVIGAYLDQNMPNYKDDIMYKSIVEDSDVADVNPEQVLASVHWLSKNIPDADARSRKVIEKYKEELRNV